MYGEVYFDKVTGLCKECPDVSTRLAAPLGLVGALLALVLVVGLIYRACKDRALQRPIYVAKRVMLRVQQLEIAPKAKLLFTFYQLGSTLEPVYNVELPEFYQDATSALGYGVFDWLNLDGIDTYFIPGQCIQTGFELRLTLRALVPFGMLVAVPPPVRRPA